MFGEKQVKAKKPVCFATRAADQCLLWCRGCRSRVGVATMPSWLPPGPALPPATQELEKMAACSKVSERGRTRGRRPPLWAQPRSSEPPPGSFTKSDWWLLFFSPPLLSLQLQERKDAPTGRRRRTSRRAKPLLSWRRPKPLHLCALEEICSAVEGNLTAWCDSSIEKSQLEPKLSFFFCKYAPNRKTLLPKRNHQAPGLVVISSFAFFARDFWQAAILRSRRTGWGRGHVGKPALPH